ncbi:MAG: nuclear transport factor 2 family protein [Planctomycetota bacterium]|nr:nuclear transport factor 2 family protein [Planctomycetota bacterium]
MKVEPKRKPLTLLVLLSTVSAFVALIFLQRSFATTLGSTGEELIQVVQKQSGAWNRGDLTEFMSPYWNDERLTFSSGGKTKRGWKATFENYKENYPDRSTMGKLTFSDLETQELGSEAMLMLGKWHLEREAPVGGNFSLVWKRIEGKWVIVHDHSSALRP